MWNERAIVLAEGENIIGRDPGCSVWLDASGVSRRHARIDVDPRRRRRCVLEDLGSKNGTLVDGSPIRDVVQVADGSADSGRPRRAHASDLVAREAPETERIARSGSA